MDPQDEVRRSRADRFAVMLAWIAVLAVVPAAWSWELEGERSIRLHPRVGAPVEIGKIEFRSTGDRIAFAIKFEHVPFRDYFLSMREFKCLEGEGEILCHVPYPYPNPGTVTVADLAWLEHSLMFLFKSPRDYGAKLWNGIYFKLQVTDQGIVGLPQAIDLNHIGAPPADQTAPPYGVLERSEIAPGTRWFDRLSIN